jgi:vacuolar protein sorting-associated protein 52
MDRSWYVETMSKTIFSLFKNYYNQLMKLEEIKADRNDLIAIEEAAVRSMFSQKVS